MKKALISIKPERVAKILNREVTVEVMETAPKSELPVELYIYCTKGVGLQKFGNKYFTQVGQYPVRNGKVVAKFTLRKVDRFYAKGKPAYAWHISDLEIFDEPKEIDDFIDEVLESCSYLEEKK